MKTPLRNIAAGPAALLCLKCFTGSVEGGLVFTLSEIPGAGVSVTLSGSWDTAWAGTQSTLDIPNSSFKVAENLTTIEAPGPFEFSFGWTVVVRPGPTLLNLDVFGSGTEVATICCGGGRAGFSGGVLTRPAGSGTSPLSGEAFLPGVTLDDLWVGGSSEARTTEFWLTQPRVKKQTVIVTNVPYPAWAQAAGLTFGEDAYPYFDPDGDGWSNLLEFAFGGDPLTEGDADKIVVDTFEHVEDGTSHGILALPVRSGATFSKEVGKLVARIDGITYQVSLSEDLADFGDHGLREIIPAEYEPMSLPVGYEYRNFRCEEDHGDLPIAFFSYAVE